MEHLVVCACMHICLYICIHISILYQYRDKRGGRREGGFKMAWKLSPDVIQVFSAVIKATHCWFDRYSRT